MTGRQWPEGTEARVQVSVRLPEGLVKEVRHLAVELRVTQGQAMSILLREALDHRGAEAAAGGGS